MTADTGGLVVLEVLELFPILGQKASELGGLPLWGGACEAVGMTNNCLRRRLRQLRLERSGGASMGGGRFRSPDHA